jgi:uncharacterized protein
MMNLGNLTMTPETPPHEPPEGQEKLLRQCVACRTLVPRERLLRIVTDRKQPAVYVVPPWQNRHVASGRSAYLCPNETCLRVALKGKKIQKALKTTIPDDILRYLDDFLKGTKAGGEP